MKNIKELRKRVLKFVNKVDGFNRILDHPLPEKQEDYAVDIDESVIEFGELFSISFCGNCGIYYLEEDLLKYTDHDEIFCANCHKVFYTTKENK